MTASSIAVSRQNLSLTNTGGTQSFGTTDIEDGQFATIDVGSGATDAIHDNAADSVAGAGGTAVINIAGVADGASYRIVLNDADTADNETNTVGQRTFEFVASADDSANAVAANWQPRSATSSMQLA